MKQKNKINKLLKDNSFQKTNADLLINFIENSIYEREKSKLFFTKIVNEIFNQLKKLFKRIGLKEKDIQYLNINKTLDLYKQFSHENIIKDLKKDIVTNKKTYNFNQNFNLPNIILNKDNIYFFEEKKASPTFVTNKIISSKFINLNKMSKKLNLDNKIVCIENADPGYDFIFNYKINGLITAFGGPNSHMSIRCNEFLLPAAIGIGEKKFQQLLKNNTLYLNCEKKMLSGV
jgi:phosphoenolpyruvate-protein kinase (PTS system EI component)